MNPYSMNFRLVYQLKQGGKTLMEKPSFDGIMTFIYSNQVEGPLELVVTKIVPHKNFDGLKVK